MGILSVHAFYFLFFLYFSFMNYIIWNCNGAYSKRFLGTLKDVVNTHKPILIGLLETKCSGEHADKIFNSLRFNYWCRVEAIYRPQWWYLATLEKMYRPHYFENTFAIYPC